MVAIACHRSQSSVGVTLQSVVKLLVYVVDDLLLNTPSHLLFPRSAGAAKLVFRFICIFGCRGWDGKVRFAFLLIVAFNSWIVGRIGSIPTFFRFVGFAARIAFQ